MDWHNKETLLRQFTSYLDSVTDIPEDVNAIPDLFSLLTELMAVKNEVKIESRQVKAALELFRESFGILKQANSSLEDEVIRQRNQTEQAIQKAELDLLLELLELRDRLQAGHKQLVDYHPHWLARFGGALEYVHEVAVGQKMLLRRLDEILLRRDVKALTTLGCQFDPLTMHAVQVVNDNTNADGVVVAETRTGFIRLVRGATSAHTSSCDRLLRPAEVTVNKLGDAGVSPTSPIGE